MPDTQKEINPEVLDTLISALQAAKGVSAGRKDPATSHTGITLHDGGGIFSTLGLEREIISANVAPYGIGNSLPLVPSVSTDPRFGSLTGFQPYSTTQPTNVCDAAPCGYIKGCNLTSRFGLIRFDTCDIDFDVVMRKYNRGDFTDLMLLGGLFGPNGNTGMLPPGLDANQVLNVVTMAEMTTAGVLAQRELVRQLWQGTVANAGEFPGLDVQIATGQRDADTGTLCPALDSDIKEFAYDDVCGTGRDIVEYVSMMAWYLQFNAQRMGLTPASWKIVVRPEMWYELSACWPCRYMTNRCTTTSTALAVGVINDENNVNLRDKMREGMYLPVNGINYQVVTDDGIFEHSNINNANLQPGEFASSLYFVPTTILGNFPVTYREYLNYRDPIAEANVALLRNAGQWFWTDNGIFSWGYDGKYWCYRLGLKTEQRIILRTPQLAGKIQHIKYTPLQHLRSPMADSPYFQDGGQSVRTGRTTYAAWGTRGGYVV